MRREASLPLPFVRRRGEQRVAPPLRPGHAVEQQPLAHAIGRRYQHAGSKSLRHRAQQHRRAGKRRHARCRQVGHLLQRPGLHARQRLDQAARHLGVHLVLMHDRQRIVRQPHVELRQGAPRPADHIERSAPDLFPPIEAAERLFDETRHAADVALANRVELERANRQRDASTRFAARHPHELKASAAQIADDPVSLRNARDDAERGIARLRFAADHIDLETACRLHATYEIVAVGSLPHRRGGDGADAMDAHVLDEHGEARHRAFGDAETLLVDPAGRGHPSTETCHHLLVEHQRRRAPDAAINDEADRIGADVDDRRQRVVYGQAGLLAACRPALARRRASRQPCCLR